MLRVTFEMGSGNSDIFWQCQIVPRNCQIVSGYLRQFQACQVVSAFAKKSSQAFLESLALLESYFWQFSDSFWQYQMFLFSILTKLVFDCLSLAISRFSISFQKSCRNYLAPAVPVTSFILYDTLTKWYISSITQNILIWSQKGQKCLNNSISEKITLG